jgi:hypothetical protein
MKIKFALSFEWSVTRRTVDRAIQALIALGILLLKSDGWL